MSKKKSKRLTKQELAQIFISAAEFLAEAKNKNNPEYRLILRYGCCGAIHFFDKPKLRTGIKTFNRVFVSRGMFPAPWNLNTVWWPIQDKIGERAYINYGYGETWGGNEPTYEPLEARIFALLLTAELVLSGDLPEELNLNDGL